MTDDEKYKTLAMDILNNIWAGGAFGEEFWGKASSQAMKNMIHAVAIIEGTPTSINDPHKGPIPTAFELHQNYPNPFNPLTNIRFQLAADVEVTLKVFDLLGREIKTLVNAKLSKGIHNVTWDGDAEDGTTLSSGVYFVLMNTENYTATRKLILLK